MTRPRLRTLALGGLAATALGVGAAVAFRAYEPTAFARGPLRDLGETQATVLDTVTLTGPPVEASLNGVVGDPGPGGTVWLVDGADGFPVAFPDTSGLRPFDRVLVVGRVRDRGGRRWLDARGWSTVRGSFD